MKKLLIVLALIFLALPAEAGSIALVGGMRPLPPSMVNPFPPIPHFPDAGPDPVTEDDIMDPDAEGAAKSPAKRTITDKPILWNGEREELIREYARLHYGLDEISIKPRAVVIHWTASDSFDSAFNHFYNVSMPDDGGGRLNVASHFLVDRDGTIYRLTPETALNRHAIGYNWCAIGIENVGGAEGKEDLTEEQLKADIALIRYLKRKYQGITWVFGHYQQDEAKDTGLYIEKVPGYYAGKIDPGPIFMAGLKKGLKNTRVKFLK